MGFFQFHGLKSSIEAAAIIFKCVQKFRDFTGSELFFTFVE